MKQVIGMAARHTIRNLRAGLRPAHAWRMAMLNVEILKLKRRMK